MVRQKFVSNKHTQWSTRFDDRHLQYYLEQLSREMGRQVEIILDEIATDAINSQYIKLIKQFPDPVSWEETNQPRRGMGQVVADSLKRRISDPGDINMTRLSIYSEPYPSGVKGSRGGRIAQYLQEGVAPFKAYNPYYKANFIHRGFPRLDYMGEIAQHIQDSFQQIAEKKFERNLRPGGRGAN